MKSVLNIKYFLLMLLMFLISCSNEDDPVQNQEEHFEAIGVVFFESGNVIGSILRGTTNDTLKTAIGTVTSIIDIKFYDENENIVDPPTEAEKTFTWEIKDENIAQIIRSSADQDEFSFNIRGVSSGITTVEFFILHEGHADFRSGEVPLKVF